MGIQTADVATRTADLLTQRLQAALSGHGTLLVLAGPGARSVARNLSARAVEGGADAVASRCEELPTSALAPISAVISGLTQASEESELRADLGPRADVLCALVPALRLRLPDVPVPERLSPKDERYRLIQAIVMFVLARAERRPLAIVIDDIHFADGATVAVLRHLSRFLPDRPILLVATQPDGANPILPAEHVTLDGHESGPEEVARVRGGPSLEDALAAAEAAMPGLQDAAVPMLERALALMAPDDPRRTDAQARLGLALAWSMRPEEAVKAVLTATDAIREADGDDEAFTYIATAACALAAATGIESATPLAEAGLRLAGTDRGWRWLALWNVESLRQIDDEDHPGLILTNEYVDALMDLAMLSADRPDPDHAKVLKLFHEQAIFLPCSSRERLREQLEVQKEATLEDPALRNGYFGLWPHVMHLAGDIEHAAEEIPRQIERYEQLGVHHAACLSSIYLARALLALGRLDDARAAAKYATGHAAKLPSDPTSIFNANALNVLAYEDELRMYLDDDFLWLLRLFGIGQNTPQPAEVIYGEIKGTRLWLNGAPFLAATGRIYARIGRPDSAVGFLDYILPAMRDADPWTNNYNRMVCDAAETLWYAERTDHLGAIEDALREKVVKPDFRYPLHDGRLSLARLCALSSRFDEAETWFDAAREVLSEQKSAPMLAICDFDQALMYLRRDDPGPAQPLLDRSREAFASLQMTGWLKRAESPA